MFTTHSGETDHDQSEFYTCRCCVGSRRDQHRRSGGYRPLTPATLAYRQLLLPIEPEEPLVVHKVTRTPEKHVNASISGAAEFMRQCFHLLAKTIIVAAPDFLADCHSAKAHCFTRPPFAHLVVNHQMQDSFPPCCGSHHFIPKRSFKAALSSIASARSRFSFAFSSSAAWLRIRPSHRVFPSNYRCCHR